MWERLWIFRFSSREKLLLQVGQRWGFSLVCVRMWISILYLQGEAAHSRVASWGVGAQLPPAIAAPQYLLGPGCWERPRTQPLPRVELPIKDHSFPPEF